MQSITYDHYHLAPVQVRAAGISKEALTAFGLALEEALSIAKSRGQKPEKAPRALKPDIRESLAALALTILTELDVETLPKITLGQPQLDGECSACGQKTPECPFPQAEETPKLSMEPQSTESSRETLTQ